MGAIVVVGGDSTVGSSGACTGGGSAGSAGDSVAVIGADSVVKAPTALQALRVLALMALTFQ